LEITYPSEEGEAMVGTTSFPIECDAVAAGHPFAANDLQFAAPQWFAVYTIPRHEKRVVEHLNTRQIEHFLPCCSSKRRWKDGSKVTLELPLFPKYLFVRLAPRQRALVLGIPGVVSLVRGVGGSPAPLPPEDIDRLRLAIQHRLVEPCPYFAVGQRARIHSGVLSGMEGVILRTKNSIRIVLSIETIMRSFSLEVDRDELELVEETS
jgi:transcription antitermination factor NusG